MPLKTSFFNPTLFKKNLSRSWPLWGGVTAVGALFPLYLILALNHQNTHFQQDEFVEFLYSAVAYFLPVFTCCYAILVAMFIWSYLHNSRSVGFMHSLSIDRTGLFVTNTLSGLAMLLIPYAVVGGLMCLIAVCCGAMHVGAVLTTIAAVILETLLFFGMGTLCAAVTGHVIAVGAYYAILNFAVPVLDLLISTLAQEFIFGLNSSGSEFSLWFSPLISLYERVGVVYNVDGVRMDLPEIENFLLIVVYGVAGIAMLALSWFLYRGRQSESAGDVVAFRWLRPVFRFGVSIVCALTLGRVLYELFWASLFRTGRYADMLPMAVCMAISGIVGYYAASMLLEKTLRVFKGSLKGVGIVCAAVLALCFVVALDLFGVEKYIPNADSIEKVHISGYLDMTCDAGKMPNLCQDVLELHQAIIDEKAYIREYDENRYYGSDDPVRWRNIHFTYTLKNGSTVERYYYLPLTAQRTEDAETYDGKMAALAKNPEMLIASVTVPENAEIVSIYLEGYYEELNSWENSSMENEKWELVYSALCRDAREGNFMADGVYYWVLEEQYKDGKEFVHDAYLYIDYRIPAAYGSFENREYGNIAVRLQPTMKYTLNALISSGALDQAMLDGWYGE